ncbi:hypothetical protein N7467_003684 [Penicillium canescens]|nr:hypothetical protein N7467_003684 [Penicillium canescens]
MHNLIARFASRPIYAIALSVFTILGLFYLWRDSPDSQITHVKTGPIGDASPRGSHPIDALIETAEAELEGLLANESGDLASAAKRYRSRHGRHPPPGFTEWFKFAKSKNALIIEEFFDQIYHDLSPYWAIEPKELRRQTRSVPTRIVLRDKVAKIVTDEQRPWMDIWHSLVETLQGRLPDLDMPINVMDETRLVVPWETINEYMDKEGSSKAILDAKDVVSEYMSLSKWDKETLEPFDPEFGVPGEGGYWSMARVGCPEGSPARNSDIARINFTIPPWEFENFNRISYHGYVSNFTLTKDACVRPELQALHGTFIAPVSVSTSHKLLPLFGGSKLPMNNEILLPPAMYWADNDFYSGGEKNHGGAWEKKYDKIVWRGAATGGHTHEDNWFGFQRHRFLSMMNSTSVQKAEEDGYHGANFKLPNYKDYGFSPNVSLTQLLDGRTETGFMHLFCSDPHCPYMDRYYETMPGIPMKTMYNYKYMPDLDGNSFSGRYRGFLLSTSLPIKSTIYNEWHDTRLIPWVHFVPMDITYLDVYGLMDYFLNGHDDVARKIALAGKSWGEKVLRREDMQIYVYRLLLEYARVCDDRREFLGYADDLKMQ